MRRSFQDIAAELVARYERSRDPDPYRVLRLRLSDEHEECASLTAALAKLGFALARGMDERAILYRLGNHERKCHVCSTPLPPWSDWWQCLLRDEHPEAPGTCASLYQPEFDRVFSAPAQGVPG